MEGSGLGAILDVVSYVFLAVMIAVCLVSAFLVSRRLKGRPRSLGVTGFLVIALATIMNGIRSLMVTFSTQDLNFELINLVDMIVAFIRLAGIITLAAALLAAGRDIAALRSRVQGRSDSGQSSLPPQQPQQQFQPSAATYAGQPPYQQQGYPTQAPQGYNTQPPQGQYRP